MGKGKAKKKAKGNGSVFGEPATTTSSESAPVNTQAMDGHNVNGWTEAQITAYNDLLVEREKLEKQRKELEQKSAKSHASRALMNENVTNIDSLFRQQKVSGPYMFLGTTSCCVEIDPSVPCHHEVCIRSKTEGLSPLEMETVRYYAIRIPAEKSERMRNALRKQRDLELVKIKKEGDGKARKGLTRSRVGSGSLANGALSRAHLSSSGFDHETLAGATRETQRLVSNILEQLDDLRMDLQSGKISTAEMQKKLDTIDEEMQAAQLKPQKSSPTVILPDMSQQDIMSSTKAFQDHIKDRIINTKGDTYSKAFHIMEHFLSASKPGDFQAAVAELKDVLRLSGPMGDELQKSFDALEGIFDSPDRLSFTGPDGKQECSSIIDLMAKMRDTLQRTGKLPEGANSELVSVFEECIKLEADGKASMIHECSNHLATKTETDLSISLHKIKSDIVGKSPIPPLTEQKLDAELQAILAIYDAKRLVMQANQGVKGPALEGFMATMVMNRAQKNPERYIETISSLSHAYASVKEERDPDFVQDALSKVEAKMKSFVEKLAGKKAESAPKETLADSSISLPSPSPATEQKVSHDIDSDAESAYGDDLPADVLDISVAAVRKFVEMDHNSNAHLKLRSYVREYGQMGLWPLWLVWSDAEAVDEDLDLQDKALKYEDQTNAIMSADNGGLKKAIIYMYEIGVCPGMCAGVISQLITDISDANPEKARRHLQELADCMQGLPTPVSRTWSSTFQHLALAMIQLYVGLYVNAVDLLQSASPLHFAVSSMSMVVSYICLTRSRQGANHNFQLMWTFINTCMSKDGVERATEFSGVAFHFMSFCRNNEYRCLSLDSCRSHMTPNPKLRVQANLPESLRIGPKQKQTSPTSDTESPHWQGKQTSHLHVANQPKVATPQSTLKTEIHVSRKPHQDQLRSRFVRDLRYAEVLKRAAKIHETTAQKALKLMQVQVGLWEDSELQVPPDLLKIMDEMLALAGIDYYHPVGSRKMNASMKGDQSRFHEHIEIHNVSMLETVQGAQRVQNLFKAIATGRLTTAFATEFAIRLKQEALCGRWQNPVRAIRRNIDKFNKVSNVPQVLQLELEKTRADIETSMQSVEFRHRWTTERIRSLIGDVYAQAPTQYTFYDLAVKNHQNLEEYCAILAHTRATSDDAIAQIRDLYSEVIECLGQGSLHPDSACIKSLSDIAHADWIERNKAYGIKDGDVGPVPESNKNEGRVTAASTGEQSTNDFPRPESARFPGIESNLRSAVGRRSIFTKGDETIAQGQSAKIHYDASEWASPPDLDSHTQFHADEPTPSIEGTSEPSQNNLQLPAPSGLDLTDYDPILNPDPSTLQRREFAQIELIMRLSNLMSSLQSAKQTKDQISAAYKKTTLNNTEDQAVFDRTMHKIHERHDACVEIASVIAEAQGYDTVKRFLEDSKGGK